MLVPKRVKHRREFRGKMRGEARWKETAFGEYGLQAGSHWITNRQIRSCSSYDSLHDVVVKFGLRFPHDHTPLSYRYVWDLVKGKPGRLR